MSLTPDVKGKRTSRELIDHVRQRRGLRCVNSLAAATTTRLQYTSLRHLILLTRRAWRSHVVVSLLVVVVVEEEGVVGIKRR